MGKKIDSMIPWGLEKEELSEKRNDISSIKKHMKKMHGLDLEAQERIVEKTVMKQDTSTVSRGRGGENRINRELNKKYGPYEYNSNSQIEKALRHFMKISKSEPQLEKQPGPPPRPGLQWNPNTKRWIRPRTPLSGGNPDWEDEAWLRSRQASMNRDRRRRSGKSPYGPSS